MHFCANFQEKLESVPFCKKGDDDSGGGNKFQEVFNPVTKGIEDYKFDCKAAVGYLAVYRFVIGKMFCYHCCLWPVDKDQCITWVVVVLDTANLLCYKESFSLVFIKLKLNVLFWRVFYSSGWKPTNLTSVFTLRTSVFLTSWYYTEGVNMDVGGC